MRLNLIADVKFNYDKAKSVIQFESTPPQPEHCGGTGGMQMLNKEKVDITRYSFESMLQFVH